MYVCIFKRLANVKRGTLQKENSEEGKQRKNTRIEKIYIENNITVFLAPSNT